MEVLPCSKHDGKSDCLENAAQRADLAVDGSRPSSESHEARENKDHLIFDSCAASERSLNGSTYYEMAGDVQNLSFNSHDSEDDNLDKNDNFSVPGAIIENPQLAVDTIESELTNNNQEGSSHSEVKTLEQDEPQAVWVKWRGKWQSGIRCARSDWPLSTLRAKPTHDRKQYLVIFFPRTRNYSWADVLLVRPINEFPQPIAYKTHKVGAKMVQDLTLARRFIMQKLSVSMLNILDQLQREALVENARDVAILKDFAMEASRCKYYSDLGRMLSKLQNMVLPRCLSSQWLQQSLQPWKQQCEEANTAECIEMLKEELADAILWDEVNLLSKEAAPMELGSDWKSWKHEVMKWFSVSNPLDTAVGMDQPVHDSPSTMGIQLMSTKRAKLEVRRADAHASSSQLSVPFETDYFNGYNVVSTASLDSEIANNGSLVEDTDLRGSPGRVSNKWDNLVVEARNMDLIQTKEVEPVPSDIVAQKSLGSGNHNRQCAAFIEAKGRQCVRYANEGDVYCCVHLASRVSGNSAKAEASPPVDSPMCGGTTVLGTKCKHRALIGSSFCKKHLPRDGKMMTSPDNKLKRKIEEILLSPENISHTRYVHAREDENSIQLDPLLDIRKVSTPESSTIENPRQPHQFLSNDETMQCLGTIPDGGEPCPETPKRHSLYCEKHIPSWLKRARNGKSRIVSKEVYIEILKDCHSKEQQIQLHQACELFYRLFKSILSVRNPVPKEVQFQWAISEASKDIRVGEFLMKLVCNEKHRLKKLWGFGEDQNMQISTTEDLVPPPMQASDGVDLNENVIKCKICSEKFLGDQALGMHWMNSHKKESQWLFRGYVCAICLDSFTNKKVLEAHVQERHHVQFVEQCMLLQCIPCGNQFGSPDELWTHVRSIHPSDLKLPNSIDEQGEGSTQKTEANNSAPAESMKSENQPGRRFSCRFCGLKFDLLPDLGRHHQAAHMSQNSTGPRLANKGIQFYAQKLKSGRLTRPLFKKGLNPASYKIRNRSIQNLKKRIQASNSGPVEIMVDSTVPEAATLGRLENSQCSAVAKLLFSEIKKTKSRPSNSEILSIASSACCKVNLQASLEAKYGALPERMYLKAAKICSEQNILVEWHQDYFICPKGCTPNFRAPTLPPLVPSSDNIYNSRSSVQANLVTSDWKMDECHCVLDSRHFCLELSEKSVILCDDVSFGQESVPVICVVDENLLNAEGPDGQMSEFSYPWESFTYVTKPMLDQSLVPEVESSQLGCACAHSTCSSEICDHVYLFDNDYEDAKDIYGKPMRGRFPYDERGRIVLEEGYLVYECNQRCSCSRDCQNRVLQHGLQVKLEIFKTEEKGWAVRAREAILRGTFVCEYIGEVIDEKEANERRDRYGSSGCRYFYEIDAHINDMSRMIEGQAPYVIDATKYGNVSRYINHSCAPNLVNHQVLVESMDSQLSHIGLYANRDISLGEELTYDFRYRLLPGEGCPCLCGSSNCRGRLF